MQRFVRIILSCAILTIVGARPAAAEWHFTPFVGFTFGGNTTVIDPDLAAGKVHFNFGGATTLIGAGPIGAEAFFVYTPGFFQDGADSLIIRSRSLAFMGNVVLATPRRWSEYGLRPFVSGGVGVLHAGKTDTLDIFSSQNWFAYNIGGGAVGFFSDRTGLRLDLRYYRNLRAGEPVGESLGPERLHHWTAAAGVVLRY